MINKKKLLANSFIYTIGSVLVQLIGLIFVKINTNILTTEEYGLYSLLLTVQGIAGIIVSLGISSGYTRFFYDYEDTNKLKNNALNFAFIFSGIIFICGIFIAKTVVSHGFNNDPKSFKYLVIILLNAILVSYSAIYFVTYKMKFNALKLSLWQVVTVFIKLIFLVILGWYLKMGIIGLLLAGFIAQFSVFIFLFLQDIKNYYFVLDKAILKKMLSYSGGLLLGSISSWVLTFIDRYFLATYIGLSSVGIYSIGYRIGSIYNPLFKEPFKKVFMPFQLKVFKDEDGRDKIKSFFYKYCSIGWLVIFVFSVYGKTIIRIIANDNYLDAYQIIPLIAFSYFLFGLTLFYAFGFHVANKMVKNSIVIIIGALLNIGLNFLLIPYFGMIGAALATIGSYFIVNIIYYYWARIYFDTNLNFFYPYKLGLIFIFFYGVYFYLSSTLSDIQSEFLLATVLFIFYFIGYLVLGIVKKTEVLQIKNTVLNSLMKKK